MNHSNKNKKNNLLKLIRDQQKQIDQLTNEVHKFTVANAPSKAKKGSNSNSLNNQPSNHLVKGLHSNSGNTSRNINPLDGPNINLPQMSNYSQPINGYVHPVSYLGQPSSTNGQSMSSYGQRQRISTHKSQISNVQTHPTIFEKAYNDVSQINGSLRQPYKNQNTLCIPVQNIGKSTSKSPSDYKKILCNHFTKSKGNGKCPNGDQCRYFHPQFICRDNQNCQKDICYFIHPSSYFNKLGNNPTFYNIQYCISIFYKFD